MNSSLIRFTQRRNRGVGLAGLGLMVFASAAVADTPVLPRPSAPATPVPTPKQAAKMPLESPIGPGVSPNETPIDPITNGNAAKSKFRQREGTQLAERRGRFERRGDRIIFLANHPDAYYVVLENLALERVVRVLDESGNKLDWSVSGTISEFRTTNYLLVTRALVKSMPSEGEADRLDDPLAESGAAPRQERNFSVPALPIRPSSAGQTLPSGALLPAGILPAGRR